MNAPPISPVPIAVATAAFVWGRTSTSPTASGDKASAKTAVHGLLRHCIDPASRCWKSWIRACLILFITPPRYSLLLAFSTMSADILRKLPEQSWRLDRGRPVHPSLWHDGVYAVRPTAVGGANFAKLVPREQMPTYSD